MRTFIFFTRIKIIHTHTHTYTKQTHTETRMTFRIDPFCALQNVHFFLAFFLISSFFPLLLFDLDALLFRN